MRSGGTASCRLSDVFLDQTENMRSVDDYLSFIEERDALSLDFVMRPQSWFVCDLKTGQPLVKRLFLYGRDHEMLSAYLRAHGVRGFPGSTVRPHAAGFLGAQKRRIQKLYAADFQLVEQLRSARTATEREILRAMGVAAE